MITTYEQTFERENAEATNSDAAAVRRQAYFLAIASFICNMVCTTFHLLQCIIYRVSKKYATLCL